MITVQIASKTRETADICLLELSRPEGGVLPAFSAGAHIDLHLPGGIVRQYSLCNSPAENHRYQIAVLRDPSSRGGSSAIHSQLKEGDKVSISEPRNLFPLEHGANKYLLIAGGIGITPILCMTERLHHLNKAFELHYCTRTPEETAFRQRIQDSSFGDKVYFHHSRQADGKRMDAGAVLTTADAGIHLYICGPNQFMNEVLEIARKHGWPESRLHREYFAAEETSHEHDTAFEIQIASSGAVIEIPADRTALEVLLEHGIDLPFACEEGVCGTCATRLLEGEPEHRDVFMTPEEHAGNEEFAACCSRARSKRLVLDI